MIIGGLGNPVSQLEQDVFKILGKRTAKQPANTFKNKCLWANRANNPSGFRKHISRIFEAAVFATNGKWLARWAAGNQFHFVSES